MPGPAPKNPKIRQRRNKVSTAADLESDLMQPEPKQRRNRIPSLPRIKDGPDWHPMTVAWWKDIWHSPMAKEFIQVDRHALFRLAALVDRFWLAPTKELGAEIRLEQQAFGLTPIDRRRLQWTMGTEERAPRQPRRTEATLQDDKDPRKLLNWVVAPDGSTAPGETEA